MALATTTEIYPGFVECVNSDARRFTLSFIITQANLICTQSANVASFLTLVVYVQSSRRHTLGYSVLIVSVKL